MRLLIMLFLMGCASDPTYNAPCFGLTGEQRDDCILREREDRRGGINRTFIMGRPDR